MAETVEGLAGLEKKLKQLSVAQQGQALRAATNFAMTAVVKEARSRIPVGVDAHMTYKGRLVAPGFAARNIAKKTKLGRTKDRAFTFVGVKPEAYYALQFVELGTSKQPPQPWLKPSYDAVKDTVTERLGIKIKERIMKFTK